MNKKAMSIGMVVAAVIILALIIIVIMVFVKPSSDLFGQLGTLFGIE